MEAQLPDYRDLLKNYVDRKIDQRPELSLRSISRKSGVNYSLMSQVFSLKKNFSKESASKLINALDIPTDKSKEIIALFEIQTAKDENYKNDLIKNFSENMTEESLGKTPVGIFELISQWHHMPIMEMGRVSRFNLTASLAAAKLGIKKYVAQNAIDRLVDFGILVKDDDHYIANKKVVVRPKGTNIAVRNFHRSMITKALDSLDTHSLDERHISGLTISVKKENIVEAKKIIEEFKTKMKKHLFEIDDAEKDSVYQLNIQFFELTNKMANNQDIKQ